MKYKVVASILLLATVVASVQAAGDVYLDIKCLLDPPYVIEYVTVDGVNTSTLAFNFSRAAADVVYAVASNEIEVVEGVFKDGILYFDFKQPTTKARIALVLRSVIAEGSTARFAILAPLAPLNAASTFKLSIERLPSQPTVLNSSGLNFTTGYNVDQGYYLSTNGTSSPGSVAFLEIKVNVRRPSPAIKRVTRIVTLEPSRILVLDNLTLVGFFNFESSTLTLVYPASFEIVGVEGLLGPYPSTSYSIEETGDGKKKVTIKLRSPPFRRGDVSYVAVIASAPLNCSGEYCEIPAFYGIGHYVANATIIVRIRGYLEFSGAALPEKKEGEFRIYELGEHRLLDAEFSQRVSARPVFARQYRLPPIVTLALTLIVFAFAGVLVYRKMHVEERASTIAKPAPPELVELMEKRAKLLESLVENLRKFDRGELGSQAYRQITSRLRRSESRLKNKLKTLAAENPDYADTIEKFDEVASQILRTLRRAESLHATSRKRAIPKRKYREELAKLEDELESLLEELEDAIASIRP